MSGYDRLTRLQSCEKAMGSCTAQYKMLLFRAQTSVRGWRNNELAHLKKERRRRRKTICMFCCCWVGYFRDAFSRHWESCWSWKHSKMNSMLSSSPFLRFGEILMYCHILRVRAIPTLESTDSIIGVHWTKWPIVTNKLANLFLGSVDLLQK